MNQQRIILVIGSASIGGAEKQLIKLASELNQRDFHSHVIFLIKGGPLENFARELNVDYSITNLSKVKPYNTILNVFRLINFVKKQDGAIFYLFLPHSILFLDFMTRVFSRKSKVVFGVRGSIFRKNNLLYKLYRNKLRKPGLIICNSNAIFNEIKEIKGSQSGQIAVIHNGVNSNPFLKQRTYSDSRKIKVAVVSNFHLYKGHDLLIEALTQFHVVPLEVTFIGNGVEFTNTYNKTLSIQKHKFSFLGHIENASEILAGHDFAIHPSRTEGLSNAILEELAAGLPVIAFNIGGNSELISSGRNGFLLPVGDTKAMAGKIELLTLDFKRRHLMSEEALASVEDFSWQKNVDKHVDFFNTN
jgi:glycosyltransferase involved in cell wall biosynthesis